MQQLHLVGFTTDLEGLIFSTRKGAKSGGYLVMLDDRLQATIEDALRLRNGDDEFGDGDGTSPSRPRRPKPESTLSPREIQARLRAGSSIAEIAAEARVDEEWVGRFAAPILAEQAQVVARARRLTFEKPRLGQAALDLGEAVRWNLADRDIRFLDDDFDAAWSAYNLQGTSWVVRFQYASRGKRQTAEWEVDLRENELFARNRIASDLAYIDATRRRRRPPVLEPLARETPASAGTRREAAPAPPPAPSVAAAPRLTTAAVAGRGAGRPAAKRASSGTASPARRAATGTAAKSAKAAKAAKAPARPTAKSAAKARAGKASAPRRATATAKTTKATPAKEGATRRASTATKTAKATKATKATGTRRAAAAKGGRATATKASAKKPAPEHRAAPRVASTQAPPFADIAERRSHLARPASPMKSANPVPPRPGEEGFRVIGRQADDGRVRLPAPRPEALQPRPRPAAPVAERRPAPPAEPVEVPLAERPAPPAPVPRPARPPASAAERPAAVARSRPASPDERLARRLATRPNGGQPAGRERRVRSEEGAEPNEPLWHGPGSGEPAPEVRIRADMAAATVRPHDHSDAAPADDPTGAPPRRRRERPLRAR